MTHEPRPGRPEVLLVDDDPEVLAGLRLSLRRLPVRVLTATSAQEALSLIEDHAVWMVISDERMPEMSGSQLLTEVRRRRPDVTRVILSGQASTDAVIAAINDARIFRFLTKPCSPDDLAATVLDGLAAHDARRGAGERRSNARVLVDQFEEALDDLWVALQPIFDARSRDVVAYEVLLRSDHDILGSPVALLDAASRLDRQFDVDRMVRRQASRVLPHLPSGTRLFVNLMPESLGDPALSNPDDALAPWADRVVFEVTERVGLDDIHDVEQRLDAIRSQGYAIALDDLGAGYAGLNSFATLRPDIVKFDMELVRDIEHSETRCKLVGSIARLCRELGIQTVAEGIESEAELATVTNLGCDLLQGFLLGRPTAARSLARS